MPFSLTVSDLCEIKNAANQSKSLKCCSGVWGWTQGFSGTNHLSAANWQTIISLFASYAPLQQARLSHYGGGKSCSIEVETPLIWTPHPLPEFGMNPPPQSQPILLWFFAFFLQHPVKSAHSTFLFLLFFCLILLHGWISFVLCW